MSSIALRLAVHLAIMQQAGNDYPVEADALSVFFGRTSLRALYCHSEIAVWLYVCLKTQNGMMALFTLDEEEQVHKV